MGFGGSGSGGGSGSIAGNTDVALNNPLSDNVLSYDSVSAKWKNTTTVIRFNSGNNTWPARPTGATWGILYLSTNSASAPAPTDANLAAGDRWQRHPDAV